MDFRSLLHYISIKNDISLKRETDYWLSFGAHVLIKITVSSLVIITSLFSAVNF